MIIISSLITLNFDEVKEAIQIKCSLKKLAEKFNCGVELMRSFLVENDLYEERCKINNVVPKIEKKVCSVCGDTFRIHKIDGVPYCKKHYSQVLRHGETLEKTIYDRNDYIFEEKIVKIILRDKKQNINGYCIIDKEDYEKIKEMKWYLVQGYCKTKSIDKNNPIPIHFVLLNSKRIDHINNNALDNTKINLRKVSQHQNTMNMSLKKNNKTGVAGVQSNKTKQKWIANLMHNYKNTYLGTYSSFDDAVLARLKGEAKYFKEYSNNYYPETNTIKKTYTSLTDGVERTIEINLEGKIIHEFK